MDVTVKVAVVEPAGTVTVAGTVTELTLLLSATPNPLDPAAPLRVIVPVEVAPPATVVGLSDIALKTTGLIVSVTPIEVEARLAVILAVALVETGVVAMLNDPNVEPAGNCNSFSFSASIPWQRY